MIVAKVLGSVTAPEQVSALRSHRLLVIQQVDEDAEAVAPTTVAVDLVGAGPGDLVLAATGSAARLIPETRAVPTDMSIVAIVDSIDLTEGGATHAVIHRRTV
jgi:ethanolamine utilization protein EutN